ncbi:MAG: type II toxin-antitoxin system VapC family toxin [Spirochaetes bacterium]|nr:type II toxin-antitoxin system VapC family toxin [Spirochaetota bacterium]
MRLLIDSNAYSNFKRGKTATVEALARADEILIPVPVLGELRVGFKGGSNAAKNLLELEEFLESPRVVVQSLGEDTSIRYAEIYASLKSAGTPIPTNDLWIAALALETGSILLSGDTRFDAVPGLIRQ